jgi:integrase
LLSDITARKVWDIVGEERRQMARRQRDRLTAALINSVTRAKAPKPGMWPDGLGLYLCVSDSGAASWIFRFKIDKRSREMGLGSLDAVTLAKARDLADAARRRAREGVDPINERNATRLSTILGRAKAMNFRQCAEAYIAAHRAGWSNAAHADQWPTSLERHAYPIIGGLPVDAIDLPLVLKVLEPIWTEKPETASRVRGRIESVLDWATVRKYRHGENPARWRGHLESLLPKKTKVRAVAHHAALPYTELADFIARLRKQEGVSARALEFVVLTASRAGEVIGARWDEIDLGERLWTIPANRMKARKEHRVPLSDAAMAIIEKMAEVRSDDLVFIGIRRGAVGNDALRRIAQKIADAPITTHGFRSTFRDWAAERSNFPHEVCEIALGHTVGDAVERAYRRGDMFEKRRQLAEAWARYCSTPQPEGRVVPIRGIAAK